MEEPRSHSEVRVEPLVEAVVVKLRNLILQVELAPGTRLRTERLAAQLGVSRTPLRTAMAILAIEGLLDYHTNRGYTVREQTVELILAAIAIRASLQAAAVRAVTARKDREQVLQYLRVAHRTMATLVDAKSWSEELERTWYEANFAFYRRIVYGAENVYLRAAIRMALIHPVFGDLLRVYPPVSARVRPEFRELPTIPPRYAVESQFDRDRLLSRMELGETERAANLVSDMIMRDAERLASALSEKIN